MSGIDRLARAFQQTRDAGSRALITYLCAGDPGPEETVGLCEAAIAGGADVLELGIPFSDPAADGPVIQRASERALAAGSGLTHALEACETLAARHSDVPIVLFGYWNPWHRRGAAKAAALARDAGASGLLVVDLPPEEPDAGELDAACDDAGIARVYLVAPTTGPERLNALNGRASGFIYLVSLKGVTGTPLSNMPAVQARTATVRKSTGLPVAVGFGISGPAQARDVGRFADGVVVGSALVQRIADAHDTSGRIQAAGAFVSELKRSLAA